MSILLRNNCYTISQHIYMFTNNTPFCIYFIYFANMYWVYFSPFFCKLSFLHKCSELYLLTHLFFLAERVESLTCSRLLGRLEIYDNICVFEHFSWTCFCSVVACFNLAYNDLLISACSIWISFCGCGTFLTT